MQQCEPLRKENGIMKTKLKDILGIAALGLTLLATTTPTWAGRVTTNPVKVGSNQTSRYASGSLVSARYSADNRQYIQCVAVAASNYTVCSAMDSVGNYVGCQSGEPKFQEVVQAMTASSYLYFVADLNGNCTHIVNYHGSDMLR
jgi:hypothetical protein